MIRETLSTVNLGVKSLLLHKLRSFLTMLGILIGVSAVVAMLAIGEGASFAAQEKIKRMGSTNILIQSVKPPEDSGDTSSGSSSMWDAQNYGLTHADYKQIKATVARSSNDIVPVRITDRKVLVGPRELPVEMLGTYPEYLRVMNMEVERGRWLNDRDHRKTDNVAVLGASMSRKLFPDRDAVGKVIRTQGEMWKIVGVLQTLGRQSGSTGRSVDDCIYIPMSTSRARFGDTNIKRSGGSFEMEYVELHEIKVQVREEDQVHNVARVIEGVLERNHKDPDYNITVPLELLAQARASKQQFQNLLFSIALISLIVGGIGIMNVMLATVTERTREIGIRRALGARKNHIVSQFLVETVVLAGTGGILGVAIGLGASLLVHSDENPVRIMAEHSVMAFIISAMVGVIAGIYPAWRAANMDPVEALRHE